MSADESNLLPTADLDPNTSKGERRLALERAKEHGLDLVEVAKLTVQLQMTATFLVRLSRRSARQFTHPLTAGGRPLCVCVPVSARVRRARAGHHLVRDDRR